MAIIEDVASSEIVTAVGSLGKWIQAVGLLVIFWIVADAITMYYNRKRRKLLEDIDKKVTEFDKRLARIENALVKKKR